MSNRLLAIFFLAAANAVEAQITTVVAPPKRREQAQISAQRAEQRATDSVAQVALTNMKEWVDSAAAALAVRPDSAAADTSARADNAVRVDSAAAPDTALRRQPASTPDRQPAHADSGRLRDGVRAPDTATQVPLMAAVGAMLLLGGALAFRRRS